jgi:hypothetical protein
LSSDFFHVHHPFAGDSHSKYLLSGDFMFRRKLIETVGIAGLQKHQRLSGSVFYIDQIFTEVCAAERVVDGRAEMRFIRKKGGGHIAG